MTSCPSGAPEERGWGAVTDAIALVGPLVIVGLPERLETALQGRPTGEVAAAKGHAPVFLQEPVITMKPAHAAAPAMISRSRSCPSSSSSNVRTLFGSRTV